MNNRRFSFVRHGKVDGPAALYGSTDIQMSAAGREDLLACLERMHLQQSIDLIVSSPLQRCATPAESYAKKITIPVMFDERIQELNFGAWDGVDFNLLNNEWSQLEKFWQVPYLNAPPGGESLESFHTRVAEAWQKIKDLPHKHTVVLCHGGTIRMIIAQILNIPLSSALFQQLHIDYCSHTRIDLSDHPDAKPIIRWIGAR